MLASLGAMAVGLGFLAYPVVMEVLSAQKAAESISEIEAVYDSMDDEAHQQSIEQAHAYNAVLAGGDPPFELWDYDTQLTYHEEPSTMMAWIDIPKIGAHLPIYHHTTEAALMAGVGHMDMTSLPVGGEGTLCALSGHSGMPNARMFDDIRLLEPGDEFVIWTLKEPYAYRVVGTEVVRPEEADVLEAQPGRDLCLLITCTPLNVNTHRLIVTAERCDYVPDSPAMEKTVASVANRRTLPLIVASCAVVVAFVIIAMPKKKKHDGDGTVEHE